METQRDSARATIPDRAFRPGPRPGPRPTHRPGQRLAAGLGAGLLLAALAGPGAVLAAERELGAHEHGHGRLNVAVEGGTVEIELIAPGADIVGFEHHAESEADKAAMAQALTDLKAGEALFAFPAAAGCRLEQAEVESAQIEHEHDSHEDEAHDDEAHEGEAHEDEEHEHGAGEEHEEAHAEFHARYRFACGGPASLSHVDVRVFERFPASRELDAQVITGHGQSAAELTAAAPRLDL